MNRQSVRASYPREFPYLHLAVGIQSPLAKLGL
jgi:hypothetical protein